MICGSTCAGCARCPTCCHGRQARAPCVARCARKWPGPLSRARDWDVFTMEVLPQLCDADPDIDPQARPRGPAPAPRSRTTRCTPTCRPNASRPCCACSGNAARRSPPPWPSARPGRCIARSAAASRVGTRCARAWITPPTRAAAPACGADPRQTPALCQRGAVAAQSIPQARALRQGPGRGALGSAQDFRTAAALGAMCVSLSTGRLAGRQATKRPCDCCAGPAMACAQPAGARCGGRLSGRRPAADGWPDARSAGAEAPRATA